jgi:hypothetical protein
MATLLRPSWTYQSEACNMGYHQEITTDISIVTAIYCPMLVRMSLSVQHRHKERLEEAVRVSADG